MADRLDPRADRSRTAALNVARDLLVEEGWDALTPARVAERSGLHRVTIYRHWRTPTALLHDLLDQEVTMNQINPTGDLRADLVSAITAIHRQLTEHRFGRIVTALIDRGEWDPDLHRVKVAITQAGVANIRQIIEASSPYGDRSACLDPDVTAAFLLGPILYRRLLSGETATKDFLELIVDSFLATQLGPPEQGSLPVPGAESVRITV